MPKFMLQSMTGETSSCVCKEGKVVADPKTLREHFYQCPNCGEPLQTTLVKPPYQYTYSRVPFDNVKVGDIVIIGDPKDHHRHEVLSIKKNVTTDSLQLRGFGTEHWVKNGFVTVEINSPQQI